MKFKAFRRVAQAMAVAGFCAAAQASSVVVDSTVTWFDLRGADQAVVTGSADVTRFNGFDQSTVDVLGGQISYLDLYNDAFANISGGDMAYVQLYDTARVRITGLADLSWLVLESDRAQVEIVASGVSFDQGHLSGVWGDGSAFRFWAVGTNFGIPAALPSNITITSPVPEPASVALMCLGLLALPAAVRHARRRA